MTLSDDTLAALEAWAAKATRVNDGEWPTWADIEGFTVPQAQYVAAANPAVVAELVRELKRLRAEATFWRQMHPEEDSIKREAAERQER